MVALRVWSLTHGVATRFVSHGQDGRRVLPMSPAGLLEAGLMACLQALGLP